MIRDALLDFVLVAPALIVGWLLGLVTAALGYSASVRDPAKRKKMIAALRAEDERAALEQAAR